MQRRLFTGATAVGALAVVSTAIAAWPRSLRAATSGAATAGADGAAPLRLLRTGDVGAWPLLAARAGTAAGDWIVDTGASRHVVDSGWAAAAGLPRRGSTRLTTVTGSRSAPLRALPPLVAGPLRWDGDAAVELDLSAYRALTGVAVAGILGMPLFAAAPLLLDLAGGRLLAGADAVAASAALALSAPLAIDDELPVVRLSIGDRPPEAFLLDTGNPGALVIFAHRAADLLRQTELPRLRVIEPGGSVDVAHALIDFVEFAGHPLPRLPAVLETGAAARRGRHFDRLAGSLGCAVFDGGALFVDPAAGVLRATPAAMPLPGGYGCTLRDGAIGAIGAGRSTGNKGVGPVVHAVVAGGPAARAGVVGGDRLIAIDGEALADGRPATAWDRLHGTPSARLHWRRGDSERTTELARERYFPLLR